MSDPHKKILLAANAAISAGDHEGFLEHCTEDTVWRFLGDKTLKGKSAVRDWMQTAYKTPPKFDVHRLIEEGDHVTAIGEITVQDEASPTPRAYCDVWRFRHGKMAELHAFVVDARLERP